MNTFTALLFCFSTHAFICFYGLQETTGVIQAQLRKIIP